MGLLKRLFAGPDTAAKLVDAGVKGIDAAWWTAEEKSEWTLKFMMATQSQNVARRFIAFLVISVFLFLLIVAALVWPISPVYAVFIMNDVVGVHLSTIVGVIIGFYFLTHTVRSINGKK